MRVSLLRTDVTLIEICKRMDWNVYKIWFVGGNKILDRNINVLYCPYKNRYY